MCIIGQIKFNGSAYISTSKVSLEELGPIFRGKGWVAQLKISDQLNETYISKKASERHNDECSICMNSYKLPFKIFITEACQQPNIPKKPIVLLSCSHVFHLCCLETFEELNFDNLPVCPECRSAYKKLELTSE